MKRRLVDEVLDEEGHDNILECSYFLLSGYSRCVKANSRIKTQKNHSYTDPNIDVTWSDCAHLIPADKNFVGGGGGNGVSDLFFRFFFDFIFEVSIFGFNGESDSESDEDELL